MGFGSSGLLAIVVAAALSKIVAGEESGAVINDVEGDDNTFSIPAFVICVRESMEGCVIAAVLLNALHKSGQYHMKKWVWFGVMLGTFAFVIIGAICLIIFYTLNRAMPGQARAAFEGIFAMLACGVLTLISFKFLRLKDLIMKWESKLVQDKSAKGADAKPDEQANKGCWQTFTACFADVRDALNIRHQSLSEDSVENNPQGLQWKEIVVITFSAMFREGLETVIFLIPMTAYTKEEGLVAGAIAGIFVGIAFGILVLVVGKYLLLDPSYFFMATTLFIFFIAAGLSTYCVIELEQIGAPQLLAINHPVLYRPVYNIGCLHQIYGRVWKGVIDTKCFLAENTGYDQMGNLHKSSVGLVFRALLGYRAAPTYAMCITYIGYWMIVTSIMMWRYRKGTLFSRYGNAPEEPEQHTTLPSPQSQYEGPGTAMPNMLATQMAMPMPMQHGMVPMQHGMMPISYGGGMVMGSA